MNSDQTAVVTLLNDLITNHNDTIIHANSGSALCASKSAPLAKAIFDAQVAASTAAVAALTQYRDQVSEFQALT